MEQMVSFFSRIDAAKAQTGPEFCQKLQVYLAPILYKFTGPFLRPCFNTLTFFHRKTKIIFLFLTLTYSNAAVITDP